MTFEKCHERLAAIRREQGTSRPIIRVDFGGNAYRGRLARADSDPDRRVTARPPFGLLVLENLGLAPEPQTILQIASIPEDGIRGVASN